MLSTGFSRLLYITALLSLLLCFVPARADENASSKDDSEAVKMLPDRVGDFRARRQSTLPSAHTPRRGSWEDFYMLSAATRTYVSAKGETFSVSIIRMRSDSAAYAFLTSMVYWVAPNNAKRLSDTGTAGFVWERNLNFFKGPVCVLITEESEKAGQSEAIINLARQLAATLDGGEKEIPVLVKHLPEAETAEVHAVFSVSLKGLQEVAGQRPVLEAVSFEGGAEAVTAHYGPSRLVIIENSTPQLATVNDARINAKLKELKDAGQPLPTAYRRVGNYSVLVFDAPDEATAAKLIDGIKYEQVVQWLGDNPNDLRRAQRRYTETTAGVILAVLKASGISLLLCLGVGAIFGGIVFKRRRQRQTVAEAFSDAGGMMRLNLDKITTPIDPNKLLGRGEQQ